MAATPPIQHHIGRKILLTTFILGTIAIGFLGVYWDFKNSPFDKGPWVSWYGDPAHSVYVGWEREVPHAAEVKYGYDPANLIFSEPDANICQVHHINLTSLLANTLYYYAVYTDGRLFRTGKFWTAPDDLETPFVCALTSDSQNLAHVAPGFHERIATAIAAGNYRFAGLVGDFVHDGDNQESWNCYFDTAKPYLNNTAFVPVIGNHDFQGENNSLFFRYFKNNANQSQTNLFFYSFNYSMVHFTVCHITFGDENELCPEQLAWLENDLNLSRSMPYRIVLFHGTVRSGGFFSPNQKLIDNLMPLLYQYRVAAIFNGHEHHYERGFYEDTAHQYSNGHKIMYVVLGCGGALFDPAVRTFETAEVIGTSPCFTELSFSSSVLELKTITHNGEIIDNFALAATGGF